MAITLSAPKSIESYLEDEAEYLLSYKAKISADLLHLPSPDLIERIFVPSDRNPQVLRSLQQLYGSGRLANTGYLSNARSAGSGEWGREGGLHQEDSTGQTDNSTIQAPLRGSRGH
ncbi:MAG: hypothetical protein AB4206_00885, partial [Xenococcaceae cyanobacterium]